MPVRVAQAQRPRSRRADEPVLSGRYLRRACGSPACLGRPRVNRWHRSAREVGLRVPRSSPRAPCLFIGRSKGRCSNPGWSWAERGRRSVLVAVRARSNSALVGDRLAQPTRRNLRSSSSSCTEPRRTRPPSMTTTPAHMSRLRRRPNLRRFEAGRVLGTPDGAPAPFYFVAKLWFDRPRGSRQRCTPGRIRTASRSQTARTFALPLVNRGDTRLVAFQIAGRAADPLSRSVQRALIKEPTIRLGV